MPVPYLDNAMDMARLLLDAGVDPSARSSYGETAVCISSGIARFDLLRLLLDRGADPSPLSWDPLLRAISIGEQEEALRSVRQLSAPPTSQDFYDRSALLMALHRGDLPLVEAIAQLGGDIDSHRSRCGTTALMHAVVGDRRDVVAWCLVHGADPNGTDEFGETALMKAAGLGSVQCVRTLIAAGANLDAESNTESKAITESRDAAVVAALVGAGADMNAIDGQGYGLLKYAAEVGNLPFTLDLLRLGASTEATSTGDTALHMATAHDELVIMRALLDHGAQVNAQDVDGWTPLFSARSVEAVHMLLGHGADPAVTDIAGGRAADWIGSTNEEAMALLPRRR
jgi:ankyrin repeat protein